MKPRPTGPQVHCSTYGNRHGERRAQVSVDMTTLGRLLKGDAAAIRTLIDAFRELEGELAQYERESKRAYASTIDPNGCLHPDRAIVRNGDVLHCLACERDLPLADMEEVA